MTGTELATGLQSGRAQAGALRTALLAYQQRIPVNATIGSAALVSGVLALVGFGAKYTLAADISRTLAAADDAEAALRAGEDAALKAGGDAVSVSVGALAYARLSVLPALQMRVAELGARVDQLGAAADLAAVPAGLVVDAGETAVDAAGNAIDTLSWLSKYGATLAVVIILLVVAVFVFSPAARGAVGFGGSKK